MGRFTRPDGQGMITRRDFLKCGGLGFAALLGISFSPSQTIKYLLGGYPSSIRKPMDTLEYARSNEVLSPNQQGRVLERSIGVFDIPSFSGTQVNTHYRDQVIPITDITVGKSEDSFNLVWYKVGDDGYAHSGNIQPVFTDLNQVVEEIPMDGTLGEVTVPFTDARWEPEPEAIVAYRFYYATTHWVTELIRDPSGEPWYGVLDDKWEYVFYVPAAHFRIIPLDELKPISTDVPSAAKRIEVHIPEQVLVAYEYDEPVFMARVASGAIFSTGNYSTPLGSHMTFHKRASRHMARGNLAANGYDLPGVPWNSYITEEGIAFHGTYWHNNFGRPRSHGCINLTPQAAKWVYLWTMPNVPPDQEAVYKRSGTIVDIIG
jgi:L,D-transpeptidase catalytic domain